MYANTQYQYTLYGGGGSQGFPPSYVTKQNSSHFACIVVLGKGDVVGRVLDSSIDGCAEKFPCRLGHLDVAVMATNLPLLKKKIVQFLTQSNIYYLIFTPDSKSNVPNQVIKFLFKFLPSDSWRK